MSHEAILLMSFQDWKEWVKNEGMWEGEKKKYAYALESAPET